MQLDDAVQFDNDYKAMTSLFTLALDKFSEKHGIDFTDYDRSCVLESISEVFSNEIQAADEAIEDDEKEQGRAERAELSSDYYAGLGV